MYEELLKLLGGTAILVGSVAWLIRSLIAHYLSKDVEKYKEQIKSASTIELEKLRSDLSRQAMEHEVQFRRLDEKIADHLTTIYQLLFDLYDAVHKYVKMIEWQGEPSKEEKHKLVAAANDKFWDYFLHNRPYVPLPLYRQIREVADILLNITRDFTQGQARERHGVPEQGVDYWMKAVDDSDEKATPMFSALVAEIQRRLGVVDPE